MVSQRQSPGYEGPGDPAAGLPRTVTEFQAISIRTKGNDKKIGLDVILPIP
jgi:hypothetical protein